MKDNVIGELIKAARNRKVPKLTQSALGRLLGVTRGAVNLWERGSTAPDPGRVRQLAVALDLHPLSLIKNTSRGRAGPAPGVVFSPEQSTNPDDMARTVPVYKTRTPTSRDKANGADFVIGDKIVDQVRRSPRLAGRTDVRAMYVHGTKMEPRYHNGELIYLEGVRPPVPGDYVVLIFKHSGHYKPSMVRRLVGLTVIKVRVAQLNPAKVETFDRSKVAEIARIMELVDIVGV